jgi:DNA-directed RNA polymerase subunit H (RpoH/RPB5)
MEKEDVSILEETWVTPTGFPRKAKKSEVVKEVTHMAGDLIKVDDNLLRSKGKVRVKVLYKDAMKVDENTLLYINGQGHLLKWISEKLEEYKKQHPQDFKGSSSHNEEEDLEEDKDNEEESSGSHDSGFARLGREQEEEEKRKKLGKGSGISQNDDVEDAEMMEFDQSQVGAEVGQECQGGQEEKL